MIHTVLATDPRTAPEKAAKPMLTVKGQLADMAAPDNVDLADPNITIAIEWDQVSPWIVLHKGKIADLKMAYLGWPMVTKEEWEAENPGGGI